MRFGDLTYLELRDCAREGWVAIVPTGCTEQQGPHLPVDFDTWFAETVALAASRRAAKALGVQSLVLPAIPFGPTPEHRNFGAGYVDLPASLHEALMHAVLVSLGEQGFRRIIVWRGCGGHDLSGAVARFNEAGRAKAFLPDLPYSEIWRRVGDPAVPGGHADSFATSLALYLRPEAVRTGQIPGPSRGPVDWSDPSLDFARYSESGVIGDPTHASAALGEALWEAIVEDVAMTIRDVATGD